MKKLRTNRAYVASAVAVAAIVVGAATYYTTHKNVEAQEVSMYSGLDPRECPIVSELADTAASAHQTGIPREQLLAISQGFPAMYYKVIDEAYNLPLADTQSEGDLLARRLAHKVLWDCKQATK